ncbi:MAG: endonuclease/exonuclease/phosphatase, partial [Chloroflexi bacterium]|nr:endonuclease/exonuclease/phosphatase [Chloroflexota bacterium]
ALKDKHYDQIAIIGDEKDIVTENYAAGVFDYFDIVYTDDDESTYVDEMGAGYNVNSKGEPRDDKQKRRHYRAWRTHQMSDHLPMWIELKVDLGAIYLARNMQPPE